MARTVAQFEATGKITPTDRGFSAMEQAGRRVGPFFTQMAAGAREVARLTQQIDDEFGKGLKDVADEQGRATTAFLRFSGLEQQDAQRIQEQAQRVQEVVSRANEPRGGGGGGGGGVKVRGFESDPFGMFNKSWGNASELSNGGPLLSHLARQHMQRTNPLPGPKNDIEGSGSTTVLRGGATNGTPIDPRSQFDPSAAPPTIIRGGQTTSPSGVTVLRGGQPVQDASPYPDADWSTLSKMTPAEREYALYGPKDTTGLPKGIPPSLIREGDISGNTPVTVAPLGGPVSHLLGADTMPPSPKTLTTPYSPPYSSLEGSSMTPYPTVAPSASVPFQPAWDQSPSAEATIQTDYSRATPTDSSSVSISDQSAPSVWGDITGGAQ